jgi:phosphatidylglycerophosphate synthase
VESVAVPLFVLVLAFHGSVPVWIPMTVLCTELAVGALDNMLTQEGIGRTPRHLSIKFGLQALFAAGFIAVSLLPELAVVGCVSSHLVFASAFGVVTLVTTIVAFGRYAPRIL